MAGESGRAVTSLSAPFPNTAAGRTALSLAAPEHVRAPVVAALGCEVLIVLDAETSGAVQLEVDTSRLAPGVYLVRVTGGDATVVRRVTVAR